MARFSSFDGANIVASFNGQVIGELQAITYDVRREPAYIESTNQFRETFGGPVYTQGTFTLNDATFDLSSLKKLYGDDTKLFVLGDDFDFKMVEPKNNAEAKRRLRKGDL